MGARRSRGSDVAPAVATYGALTMVALCFPNGLQQGELQAFSQATEGIRHALHVSDFALGTLSFMTGVTGAFGAVPIGLLCTRHARTRVLAGMFATWAVLIGILGLSRPLSLSFLGIHA